MDITELGIRLGMQVLLAMPACYFLARALQGGLPSRRRANLALACGLAALVMPEKLFPLPLAEYPALFIALGIARVVLGIAGLVLAALAMARRGDGGVGSPRLLAATMVSMLHAMLGIAALLYADTELPGPPRVYASPGGAFELTLPAGRWKEVVAPKCVVAFSNKQPEMFAKVRTVAREQTASDFEALAQLMIERIDSLPRLRGKFDMEDGKTPSGNSYRYFCGLDQNQEGKPIYGAYSVVWSPRTGVLVEISFEGLPQTLSAAGKAAELETIEQAARTICLSVE